MPILIRFSALMSVGLLLAVSLSLFDPATLSYRIPTIDAVSAFPFATVSPALALGIVLGFAGSIRYSVLRHHLARVRAALLEAIGVLAVAVIGAGVLFYL